MSKCRRAIATRKERFCAAHRLHSAHLTAAENASLYGKCNAANGHGHNYTVEVSCCGPIDPVTGMVVNLADLKRIIQAVIEPLDHSNLDKDIEHFRHNVSTSENVAAYILDKLLECMAPGPALHSVVVHETDNQYFTVENDCACRRK